MLFLALLVLSKTAILFCYQTQIEAHLSCKRAEIAQHFSASKFTTSDKKKFTPEKDPLIRALISNARQHLTTHYECYHAQSSDLRIVQDFYKEIRFFLDLSIIKKPDFHFLRIEDPIFSRYTGVHDFLVNKLSDKESLNDGEVDMYTSLLSVNFSPFGNFDVDGESTFDYFLANHSVHSVAKRLVFRLLDALGITKASVTYSFYESWIKRFEKLFDAYSSSLEYGTLFQILIPKKKIDQIAYTSHSYGIPATDEQEDCLEPLIWVPFSLKTKLLNKLFDGDFLVSTYLELYRTAPQTLKKLTHLQGRLLITQQELLNPESNILIKRFTSMPFGQEQQYYKELKELCDELMQEWLTIPNVSLHLAKDQQEKRVRLQRMSDPSLTPFSFSSPFVRKKYAQLAVSKVRECERQWSNRQPHHQSEPAVVRIYPL